MRRGNCQRCGVRLLAPLHAQTIRCPNCLGITEFRFTGYENLHPASSNKYSMGTGISPYYNYWKPTWVLPPSVHHPKRAVLCGVTYKDHPKSLKGSIDNVKCMRYLLVEKFGFPNACVILLTEEEKDPCRIPTKCNIRAAMQWLVRGCQAGDSLVFYYSGHGSRVRDRDCDETDGYDEALCPLDYETEGKMLDDELNATIVRPLPRGAVLHAIIDTCYSGTFLDLPYPCRMDSQGYYKWEHHCVPYAAYKGTRGGLAISISACDDHQNSADTTAFTGRAIGALTYSFIQTMECEPRLTYGRLLFAMRKSIHEAQNAGGQYGIFATRPEQEPMLSSSEPFEIYSKQIVL